MFLYCSFRTLLINLGSFKEVERLYHVYIGFFPFERRATFLHIVNNARRFNATERGSKYLPLFSIFQKSSMLCLVLTGCLAGTSSLMRRCSASISAMNSLPEIRKLSLLQPAIKNGISLFVDKNHALYRYFGPFIFRPSAAILTYQR